MASSPPESVLAVDQSLDECRFVGIRATADDAARVHVAVEFVVDDEAAMWAAVDEALTADRKLLLAVGGTLEVHVPGEWRERYVTFGTAELAKWTGLVKALVIGRRVSHDGSVQLAEQVNRAVAVPSYGGNLTLSAQKSPGPIEMARCMVIAVALASQPRRKQRSKGLSIGFST